MLIFVICYIISKEEDIPAHFSAEVFCATAFDKFVDDATQCILGCTRRASQAALLCRGGAQPARRVCNRVENRTYRVVTRVVSRVIIERTLGTQRRRLNLNDCGRCRLILTDGLCFQGCRSFLNDNAHYLFNLNDENEYNYHK